jgi:hypothetical protein
MIVVPQVEIHQSSLKSYFDKNIKLTFPKVNIWGDKNYKRPF